uniref:Uncharacterized protein n=1 Tax=Rhizophora mucronata TaxID=61149 RepID=A0A2P2NR94_RHIMU
MDWDRKRGHGTQISLCLSHLVCAHKSVTVPECL